MRSSLLRAAALAAALSATAFVLPPAIAQQPAYTPAQTAWLRGELRRAQEKFVRDLAAISGVPEAKIRTWMPTDGNDTGPRIAVLPALERERRQKFTDQERQKVLDAERARVEAYEKARATARNK